MIGRLVEGDDVPFADQQRRQLDSPPLTPLSVPITAFHLMSDTRPLTTSRIRGSPAHS